MSTNHSVIICRAGDFIPSDAAIGTLEESLREERADVAVRICEADTWRETDISSATIFFGWPSNEMLERMPRLEWIQLPSAGASAFVGHPQLADDVAVTTSSGVFGIAGAEHALALLFSLARGMRFHVQATIDHVWGKHARSFEINDSTICVVGLGSIGSETARRLHALGAHVVGIRRRVSEPRPDYLEELLAPEEADDCLSRCDAVVLAMPETPQTRGFLSRERIAMLRDGALVVNVGRGSAIDQEALVAALESGHIGGAGLDVTSPEPLPGDHPLWRTPNVVITSHSMNVFDRKDERRFALFTENFARHVRGDALRNLVDHERGY